MGSGALLQKILISNDGLKLILEHSAQISGVFKIYGVNLNLGEKITEQLLTV